ncbi:hypothetical protein MNO14_10050 [Luteimonas sp. S4-F44]|uniref:hypothetical protein n=1 Tax=Luteimonas sp. S4-F44 TaxID=2925842 RepID=UPI001F539AF9|nr:hypothetical protein [Luteimonas sp. S4-F44]UNK41324.1 hypothetical protein MNO14_10050 [Luteimonas sp. S4-F44]
MIELGLVLAAMALVVLASVWAAVWPLRHWRRVRRIATAGVRREAEVLAATAGPGAETTVTLAFDNLGGHRIQEAVTLVDTRPQLRRFAPGAHLSVRLAPDPRRAPQLVIEGGRSRPARWVWALPLLPLGIAALCAWRLRLRHYQAGGEWSEMFGHGQAEFGLAIAVLLLVAVLVFVARVLRRHVATVPAELRYGGVPAVAEVLSAEHTGTVINDAPVIALHLRFVDRAGVTHTVVAKRAIAPLRLARVESARTLELLYLPAQPTRIALPTLD